MDNIFYEKSSYLSHHGVLGMKWGVRRYQNKDGSLTSAGIKRYGSSKKTRTPKQYSKLLTDHGTARSVASYNIGRITQQQTNIRRYPFSSKLQKEEANAKLEVQKDYYKKVIEKADAEIKKISKEASSKGYEISEKQVRKNINAGKDYVSLGVLSGLNIATIPLTGFAILPFGAMANVISKMTVPGKKYKVSEK